MKLNFYQVNFNEQSSVCKTNGKISEKNCKEITSKNLDLNLNFYYVFHSV